MQNSTARLIPNKKKGDHSTPVLESLHWLPVHQRINYKLLVLVFRAIHENSLPYLNDLLHHYVPTRSLRSASDCLLVVPKSKSKLYHDRAFSVAGPLLWNKLPASLRRKTTLDTLKSSLKTHLFEETFHGRTD